MSESTGNHFETTLRRLIVEKGLATEQEVTACVKIHKAESGCEGSKLRSLGDLLISQAGVTSSQLERLRPVVEESGTTRNIPGYEYIRQLGAGAMAKVYLFKQLSLDRLVAVKMLPRKFTNNKRFIERFYAEGKAAGKLNHPNIVGALDVFNVGGKHYFVMEYVEGKSVYEQITRQKRYSESEALGVTIQVARALDHAHKNGLVHRDVKPKNIMITVESSAKLADMGLARPVDDVEAAEAEKGKAYGTPYYISPEQIRGMVDVDGRADIYGLGATLYHMVTGQVPFDGSNPSAVMHRHLKAPVPPPDQFNSSLSDGICEIIEVCMTKDRDSRYASASELLEDLEAVKRGAPPTQARRKFDLAALSALEPSAEVPRSVGTVVPQKYGLLTTSPLFWVAIIGWFIAFVLLVVVVILESS